MSIPTFTWVFYSTNHPLLGLTTASVTTCINSVTIGIGSLNLFLIFLLFWFNPPTHFCKNTEIFCGFVLVLMHCDSGSAPGLCFIYTMTYFHTFLAISWLQQLTHFITFDMRSAEINAFVFLSPLSQRDICSKRADPFSDPLIRDNTTKQQGSNFLSWNYNLENFMQIEGKAPFGITHYLTNLLIWIS